MKNPRIEVDLKKLEENISFLAEKVSSETISVMAVTKVFEAYPDIIELYNNCDNVTYLADSRIENIISYKDSPKQKVLIRIPMHSEIKEVIKYVDVSFNSEISTLMLLNEEAKKQGKIHQVVLMIDLGDLREGFFVKADLMEAVEVVQGLSNIKLNGLAVNLTCYGAIIPEEKTLERLVSYKNEIEDRFNVTLDIISGGNSSSIYLLDSVDQKLPAGISNLRIGEAFLFGRETAYGEEYKEMNGDVFTLITEVVEYKEKPSYPIGKIGVDAFGNAPQFVDKGDMVRGIVGIGKQDVEPTALSPIDKRLEIIGASSDHLIIDFTNAKEDYKVGSEIKFRVDYGSLLSCFTSKYVKKDFVK
ncbi:ornithine racemase Orr [Vagococcus fessus]|uniref:Alanine racemase n=1 Tax=Vagococcus fessus TaxID=120370 RepID=A0A430AD22_9ENTE|nr:ornithine racemase Orr [Vagococcus fessus]RSU05124.1 alanine racemase [Vagococcus fessus]